jgi:oligoendopeptidase F
MRPLEQSVLITLTAIVWNFLGASAPAIAATDAAAPFDWDLDAQYPDESAWTTSQNEIRQRLARFEAQRGKPIASAAELADSLDVVRHLRGRAGHMARFAILHTQVDETSELAKVRLEAATRIEAEVEAGVSWIDAAVLANGTEKLKAWIAQEPRLRSHGFHLNRILALSDHLPAAGSEGAVASLERAAQTPAIVYEALMQADLGWPKIKIESGAEVQVDADGFGDLRRDPDANTRKAANRAFFARIKVIEEPLGVLLTRRLGANLDLAHARHYSDAIDAFFNWGDGLREGTYRKMVEVARANRATLDRFAKLVARVNNLQQPVELDDLYAPAPRLAKKFTFAETADNIVAAWAPMGADYQKILRQRLAKPWMDWRPRPHKHGGGVYWGIDGSDPYTVINFDGSLRGTKTLAAAAALIMFYASIPTEKAPEQREADYPVYGNAIWFLGQMLYGDYQLAHTTDKAERIAILYDDCRRSWDNYFPYAIFVELEEEIYAGIETSRPLSGAAIASSYRKLLREYYGDNKETVRVDDSFGELALVEGNTYYGEVLAEWAFAMASAAAIAERVEAGDAKSIAALKNPMSRPGSFTSEDLLIDAGVDIYSPQPYEALVRRLDRAVEALDKELAH